MKPSFRLFSSVAAVLLAGSILQTGCSARSAAASAPGNTAPAASSAEKVTVQFWYGLTGANGDIVKKYVKKFNDSQDKIVVEATGQGDYYANATKIQAALVAKNQPDMAQLEISQVGQFGKSGALADLSQYLSEEEVTKYQEGLMKNSYVDNKLVAVPFNRSTPIMYINVDMLKKAGLDPAGPKSWNELKQFAEKLTDKSKGVYGYETPIDIWFYQAGVAQEKGEILNADNQVSFNNETGTGIVKLWQDMVKAGTMKVPAGKNYDAWDAATQDFLNQKTAMIEISTGSLSGLIKNTEGKFELGTAFLPAGKQFGTPTGGANIAILKASSPEKQKACAEFIKFLGQKENASGFSKDTGYMPATNEAVQSDEIQKLYSEHPQYKTALAQLQYAVATPMTKGWTNMQNKIQDELLKCMLDTSITPEQAVENAAKQVQGILDQQ